MFTNDLACEQSRGVLIYVDKCLECNEINIGKKFKENIFIRLNSDLVIGNIYRSPNSNVENNNELCSLIQELSEKFSNLLLLATSTLVTLIGNHGVLLITVGQAMNL